MAHFLANRGFNCINLYESHDCIGDGGTGFLISSGMKCFKDDNIGLGVILDYWLRVDQ